MGPSSASVPPPVPRAHNRSPRPKGVVEQVLGPGRRNETDPDRRASKADANLAALRRHVQATPHMVTVDSGVQTVKFFENGDQFEFALGDSKPTEYEDLSLGGYW